MILDDMLQDLATTGPELPGPAIRWALDDWDQAGPRFVMLLDGYARGDDRSKQTEQALFLVIHLLGENAETAATAPPCRLLLDGEASDLFLCSQDRLRSPAAEQAFSTEAAAGLDADVASTPELLEWVDIVFVMEKSHRSRHSKRFKQHLCNARVICLDIPDDYVSMQPELVQLLHDRVDRHIRRRGKPHGG